LNSILIEFGIAVMLSAKMDSFQEEMKTSREILARMEATLLQEEPLKDGRSRDNGRAREATLEQGTKI
jgi:hypothetical protein